MTIFKDKKSILIPITIGIFQFAWLYFIVRLTFNNNMLIGINNVTWNNIDVKIINDYCGMLLLPTILIIINRKHISDFKLSYKGIKEIIPLLLVMIMLFILHNDFTITGFYKFFFYLLIVAFGEEFIYRGFLYNRLKGNSEMMAIVISGILWGIPHAILPSVLNNAYIGRFLLSMNNEVIGGIVMGWYFIYLQEKSETLWIPILVHAILDYSIGYIGAFTAIGTFVYFILKSKLQKLYL